MLWTGTGCEYVRACVREGKGRGKTEGRKRARRFMQRGMYQEPEAWDLHFWSCQWGRHSRVNRPGEVEDGTVVWVDNGVH